MPPNSNVDILAAGLRTAFRRHLAGLSGPDRDVRKMPPGALARHAAVDMGPLAVAAHKMVEAREAAADAKFMLGRAALDAHFAGCPLLTMAETTGVDRHTISRSAWAYFDTAESAHGVAWRKALEHRHGSHQPAVLP